MTFNDKKRALLRYKNVPKLRVGAPRVCRSSVNVFFPGNPPGSPRGLMGSLPTVITPFKGRLLSTYPFFFFFFFSFRRESSERFVV